MNRLTYSTQAESYLIKNVKRFFEYKLTEVEEIQLFQDLADTGLAWQLGPEISLLTGQLINTKVIKAPPSGFTPPFKLSDMIIKKKVILN